MKEEWDLYHESGAYLRRTYRGVKIPPHCYHKTVEVIATDARGHMLLTRRALSKQFGAGMYEFPAGSVIAGETEEDAARRELREETGIIATGEMRKLAVFSTPGMQRHLFITTVSDLPTLSITLQPEETMDYRIATFEDWMKIIADGLYDESRLAQYTAPIYDQIRAIVGSPNTVRSSTGARPIQQAPKRKAACLLGVVRKE